MTTSTGTTGLRAVRTTERLDALIAAVREAVARGLPPEPTAYLVGDCLAPHLGAADLLTPGQLESDPARYRQHLLHAEPDGSFSVVALVWLPGQGTTVHDHVAWCTTGVHLGEEYERRYRLIPSGTSGATGTKAAKAVAGATGATGVSRTAARLVATGDVVNAQGDVCGFAPPGDIHRVWNAGTGRAVSLHVYGADISRLGTSVRRVYALPADR